MSPPACLLLFTKPARSGRVKTRLVGARVRHRVIAAADASSLHAALLDDLVERLAAGVGERMQLLIAWALAPGDDPQQLPGALHGGPGIGAIVQRGIDLGERLFLAMNEAAREHPFVAAVGSDHPTLALATVCHAFDTLAADDGDVALGPSLDGGYYLIAVRRESLSPRLFAEIDWSTERVYAQTRERCRELGLRVHELPVARDVDRAEDVLALAEEIAALEAAGETVPCPRTRAVLAEWELLPPAPDADANAAVPEAEGSRACAS